MRFEWDEAKRAANLHKHGVDFIRAQLVFDGRPVVTAASDHPEEPRFLTVGEIDGRVYSVIWTWRRGAIRIISARRARHAERERYLALHGGGA